MKTTKKETRVDKLPYDNMCRVLHPIGFVCNRHANHSGKHAARGPILTGVKSEDAEVTYYRIW